MHKEDKPAVARRVTPSCALCGCPLRVSVSRATLCQTCSTFVDQQQHDWQRRLKALNKRVQQGRRLGNGGAVEYPHGLSYDLMRLVETVRTVQARVRVLKTDTFNDSQDVVLDGHLRRVHRKDDHLELDRNKLGFFLSPTAAEPLAIFQDVDYEHLNRIICIDPLLLGAEPPRTLWERPNGSDERQHQRQNATSTERLQALLFAVHLFLAISIMIGFSVPYLIALLYHQWLDAAGWGLIWFFSGVTAGVSVGMVWDGPPWPRISLVWHDTNDTE